MLSEADVKKYMLIQAKGIAVPSLDKLISVNEAVKLVGITKANVLKARCKKPAVVEERKITWFVVGPIIMLDNASLIQEALRREWIEEV